MSTYFLTDTGDRIISDDTYGIVSDPTQVFCDSASRIATANGYIFDTPSQEEWFNHILTDAPSPADETDDLRVPSPIPPLEFAFPVTRPEPVSAEESLSTQGVFASDTIEVVAPGVMTSPVPVDLSGKAYLDSVSPEDATGTFLSDGAIKFESLETISTEATNYGVQVDPGTGFRIVFDDGTGLLLDPLRNTSPMEMGLSVRYDSSPAHEFVSSILRDSSLTAAFVNAITVILSDVAPLDFLDGISRLSLVPSDIARVAGQDTEVTQIEFIGPLFSTSSAIAEILNVAIADGIAVVEIGVAAFQNTALPEESAGTLAIVARSTVEALVKMLLVAASVAEIVMSASASTFVRAEILSSERADTAMAPSTVVTFADDAPSPVDHGIIVPVTSPAPVEETLGAVATSVPPVERLAGAAAITVLPLQFIASIRSDAAGFQISAQGILFTDAIPIAERLLAARADAAVALAELASAAGLAIVPDAPNGLLFRDAPASVETNLPISTAQPVPVAVGGAAQGEVVPAPLETIAPIQTGRPSPAESLLTVLQTAAMAPSTVALAFTDSSAQIERTSTVFGLTASGLTYRGTLGCSTAIAAEAGTVVAAAAAAVVEEMQRALADAAGPAEWRGSMARDTQPPAEHGIGVPTLSAARIEEVGTAAARAPTRAEWRGALVVDTPMRTEALTKMLGGQQVAVIEITLSVERDGRAPIAFYGYALIPQPSLQGSKVAVDLMGSKVAVDLEGSKVQVVLVGSIK